MVTVPHLDGDQEELSLHQLSTTLRGALCLGLAARRKKIAGSEHPGFREFNLVSGVINLLSGLANYSDLTTNTD